MFQHMAMCVSSDMADIIYWTAEVNIIFMCVKTERVADSQPPNQLADFCSAPEFVHPLNLLSV
jgi:hypothetical protein